MKTVRGRQPLMPKSLMLAAANKASRLGREVAGDDLFLLAIAGLEESSTARRALELEGAGLDRLTELIPTRGDEAAGSTDVTFPPSFYSLHGWAQGFAASSGDGTVTAEHVLIALLWDPASASSQLLWRLGIPRERVVARLQELGAPVPAAPLPVQHEVELGQRVWFERDETSTVVTYLRERLGTETRWGFNYEGERAWAHADADVDLETLVTQALVTSES